MTLTDILLAMGIGFLFGFVLDKGGLNRYHKIANVFRFTDLTVLRFMMTGMLVGVLGIYTLQYLGILSLTDVAPSVVARQIVGGLVFGVGMAAAGFCPGTCIAGAARGQIDYLVPGLLGFLTGGLVFGLLYPTDLVRWLMTTGAFDQAYAKLPEILGVDPMLFMLVIAEAIFLTVYVLRKTQISRHDKLAQAALAEEVSSPVQTVVPAASGD